jgi:hypothetical protein
MQEEMDANVKEMEAGHEIMAEMRAWWKQMKAC